ncbi:hypothetical protein [Brachybacterium paraconglomeratum]|uniref:hypothetical protein n=1 Tax=Brachybacterium paraconglomeratum TaxID=173362 RepID=UPI0038242905
MKCVAVWKGSEGRWWAEVCPATEYRESPYIHARVFSLGRAFPTHAAAVSDALAEVGLTEKNTEKEKDR